MSGMNYSFQEMMGRDDGLMSPVFEATRRAMEREAARLEEQARIFLAMGYTTDELTMLIDRRTIPWTLNIVPKSDLENQA